MRHVGGRSETSLRLIVTLSFSVKCFSCLIGFLSEVIKALLVVSNPSLHQLSSLIHIYEGLQLHQALLSTISPLLEKTQRVTDLMNTVRDLAVQISKVNKTNIRPLEFFSHFVIARRQE